MISSKGRGRPGPYTKNTDPDEGRMLYVGNVPWNVNWQELKDHMRQVGTVEFVQELTDEWGEKSGFFVRYSSHAEAQQALDTLNGTPIKGAGAVAVELWTGPKPMTTKGDGKGDGKGGGEKGGWQGAMMAMMEAMWYGKDKWHEYGGKGGSAPPSWSGGYGGGGKGYGGKGYGGKGGCKGNRHDKSLKVWVGGLPPGVGWQALKDHFRQSGSVEFSDTKGNEGEVRFSTADEARLAIDTLNGSEFMGAAITVTEWS